MKKKQPRRSRSSRCVIQFSMRYEAEYAYCWRECGAIPIGWGADMAREFYDILVYPDVKEADSTRRWRASPKSYTCEFRIWHPSTLTLKPVPAGIEILLYRTFSMDKLLDHVAEDQALSLTVEETLVLLRKTLRAATFETVRLDLDDDENEYGLPCGLLVTAVLDEKEDTKATLRFPPTGGCVYGTRFDGGMASWGKALVVMTRTIAARNEELERAVEGDRRALRALRSMLSLYDASFASDGESVKIAGLSARVGGLAGSSPLKPSMCADARRARAEAAAAIAELEARVEAHENRARGLVMGAEEETLAFYGAAKTRGDDDGGEGEGGGNGGGGETKREPPGLGGTPAGSPAAKKPRQGLTLARGAK